MSDKTEAPELPELPGDCVIFSNAACDGRRYFSDLQMADYARAAIAAAQPFIIADFLESTGQYVTNDASREAAIKDAVAAALADIGREGQGHNADWCAGWNAHLLTCSRAEHAALAAQAGEGRSWQS